MPAPVRGRHATGKPDAPPAACGRRRAEFGRWIRGAGGLPAATSRRWAGPWSSTGGCRLCPPCIKPYEDDYAAYRKRNGDQIVVLELAYYPTDRCIVTGRELGKETAAIDHVLGNRLVRVADEAAVARLEADPDTYNQKLDRIIIEAERKDYPLTTCVVQGSTLDPKRPPAEVVVGNRLMKLSAPVVRARSALCPPVRQKVNEAWPPRAGFRS